MPGRYPPTQAAGTRHRCPGDQGHGPGRAWRRAEAYVTAAARTHGVLAVRDLLVGPRRYGELAAGLPRIPSNILAARLKELQATGVIRRVPHLRVVVYELMPYGRELEPVVLALGAWGFKAMGDPREEQIITPDSTIGRVVRQVLVGHPAA